jgi:hypothetical protein
LRGWGFCSGLMVMSDLCGVILEEEGMGDVKKF